MGSRVLSSDFGSLQGRGEWLGLLLDLENQVQGFICHTHNRSMLVEGRNLWLGNLGGSVRGRVGRDLGRRMVGVRSDEDVLDLGNGNGGNSVSS